MQEEEDLELNVLANGKLVEGVSDKRRTCDALIMWAAALRMA